MRSIKMVIGDRKHTMRHTTAAYRRFMRTLVRHSRAYLDKHGKNATGALRKAVRYDTKYDDRKQTITLAPDIAVPYWAFVEYGVQGAASNAKAPESPFRFGTGTGPAGKLVPSIDRWVIVKGLPEFRDAGGRFVPRKEQVRRISRNIYMYGIEPTPFLSDPMTRYFSKYKEQIATALSTDIEEFLGDVTGGNIEMTLKI